MRTQNTKICEYVSKPYYPAKAKKGKPSRGKKKESWEITPKSTDVLFGRGTNSNEHNKNYHNLLSQYCSEYKKAIGIKEKQKIVESIINSVKEQGGSFLNKEKRSKPWYVADDKIVIAKVKQALRDRGNKNKAYANQSKHADEPLQYIANEIHREQGKSEILTQNTCNKRLHNVDKELGHLVKETAPDDLNVLHGSMHGRPTLDALNSPDEATVPRFLSIKNPSQVPITRKKVIHTESLMQEDILPDKDDDGPLYSMANELPEGDLDYFPGDFKFSPTPPHNSIFPEKETNNSTKYETEESSESVLNKYDTSYENSKLDNFVNETPQEHLQVFLEASFLRESCFERSLSMDNCSSMSIIPLDNEDNENSTIRNSILMNGSRMSTTESIDTSLLLEQLLELDREEEAKNPSTTNSIDNTSLGDNDIEEVLTDSSFSGFEVKFLSRQDSSDLELAD